MSKKELDKRFFALTDRACFDEGWVKGVFKTLKITGRKAGLVKYGQTYIDVGCLAEAFKALETEISR